MSDIIQPPWDPALFLEKHDAILTERGLSQLIYGLGHSNPATNPLTWMRDFMESFHRQKALQCLKFPERGWNVIHAWLALRETPGRTIEGDPSHFTIRAGDVIIVEHQWDRDLPITHVPADSMVSGYLLSGKWPEMVGLFMPLYSKQRIEMCILARLEADKRQALEKMEQSSRDWQWPAH